MSSSNIQTVGRWQYTNDGKVQLKRRVGAKEWIKADSPPPTEHRLELRFVQQYQAPGEPNHWSLSLALESLAGEVFQVKGDAVHMHYAHVENINPANSKSYKAGFVIAYPTDKQAEKIRSWANREPPPRAANQAAVTENCQGWIIRVIGRLVAEGIVEQKWMNYMRELQQPVR
ncbi:MAG: hypothetical protein M1831_001584 [Alyxoria varia]|nr:MAG: hypothetical protein M1831_001584 [Alyxoria varia]